MKNVSKKYVSPLYDEWGEEKDGLTQKKGKGDTFVLTTTAPDDQ